MPLPNDTPMEQDPLAQAVGQAQFAILPPEDQKAAEKERNTVKKIMDEYQQGRSFDKPIRAQYAIDRRYAAGTNDPTWAVNANLIGSFIDILVSFLYARNPDVSCKKAPQVDNRGTKDQDAFAKTMELVVSRLWKKARLKSAARKQVRSALSVGTGWLKVVLICDKPENPEMNNKLNDLRDNIARLEAVQTQLASIEGASTAQADAEIAEQQELIDSLQNKIEATIRKYLAVDFVAAQDMQVSLDVSNVEDHLDANWNANAIYILRSEAKEKFPRLTDEDIKAGTTYYQRQVKDLVPLNMDVGLFGTSSVNPDEAEYYTSGSSTNSGASGTADGGPEFLKVVELWDRRTNHIKTMIDGIQRWAKEPYQPPYASSRFFPYFRLAFYEVDGARHAQSLTWRLMKLQDEYASSRSNFRLTRERAIPGVIFNSSAIGPDEVKKITSGTQQELIGIALTDPSTPMQNIFISKPVEKIDPRMFDNAPILADMEKISGVQEALQSSATPDKTATQANIEQSGFASRTTSDRDSLEDMLNDLANYTGELALGGLTVMDAQRIAGPAAFWPAGMAIDDLVTMVEIEIEAGTTGKPNAEQGQQAWGVILPTIKEALVQINEATMTGNIPLAKSISELVRETMSRMGDDTDPERFLPPIPDASPLGATPAAGPIGAAPPGSPGPSLPPSAGPGDGGALSPPELSAPNLQPPVLQ